MHLLGLKTGSVGLAGRLAGPLAGRLAGGGCMVDFPFLRCQLLCFVVGISCLYG